MKHTIKVLAAAAVIIILFGVLLNRISFDENFSMIDIMTGATKHSTAEVGSAKKAEEKNWSYSPEDFGLDPADSRWTETEITADGVTYTLLMNDSPRVMLTDSENEDYRKASEKAVQALEQQGCEITVKPCTNTLFLSYARAGRFDVLLLRKEAAE